MNGLGTWEPARLATREAPGGWRLSANGRELVVAGSALHTVADLGIDGPNGWALNPAPGGGASRLARDFLLFYFFGRGKLSKSVNYAELVLPAELREVPAIPPTVSLLLSNACNMKCVHCYNDSGKVAKNELSSAERMELVDYIVRWGVRTVAITGGEPLIHRDALPVMQQLADNRIKMRVSTNAWVIEEGVLELVRRGAIFKVNVSLDGASAESHDKYRLKEGSYARVLHSLPALREAGLAQLNLSVAVYDDNLNELSQICELAQRGGATSVSFKPVTMSARSERKRASASLPMADATWSLSEHGLARYRKLRDELRDTYQTDEMKVEGAINSAEVPEAENDAMNCHGAEEALFIASNGDLTPCELVTEYLDVPNVRTTPAASAWLASQAFDDFRAANAARRRKDERGMSGCPAMLFARQKAQSMQLGRGSWAAEGDE